MPLFPHRYETPSAPVPHTPSTALPLAASVYLSIGISGRFFSYRIRIAICSTGSWCPWMKDRICLSALLMWPSRQRNACPIWQSDKRLIVRFGVFRHNLHYENANPPQNSGLKKSAPHSKVHQPKNPHNDDDKLSFRGQCHHEITSTGGRDRHSGMQNLAGAGLPRRL